MEWILALHYATFSIMEIGKIRTNVITSSITTCEIHVVWKETTFRIQNKK